MKSGLESIEQAGFPDSCWTREQRYVSTEKTSQLRKSSFLLHAGVHDRVSSLLIRHPESGCLIDQIALVHHHDEGKLVGRRHSREPIHQVRVPRWVPGRTDHDDLAHVRCDASHTMLPARVSSLEKRAASQNFLNRYGTVRMHVECDAVTDQDLLAFATLQPAAKSGLHRFTTGVNAIGASRLG